MKNKRVSNLLASLALCVLPLFLSFSGLDVTDLGLSVSNYDWFFKSPESIGVFSHLWLTNLVGATWLALFSGRGIFAVKLGGALLLAPTVSAVIWLLEDFFEIRDILIGLLITEFFYLHGWLPWLEYNTLSTVALIWTVCLIGKALRFRRLELISLAGFVAGLSPFLRLSNAAVILLVFFIPLWFGLKKGRKETFCYSLFYIGGMFFGAACISLLIFKLGQLAIYRESIKELFSKDPVSGHYIPMMVSIFVTQHGRLFAITILLSCLIVFTALLLRFVRLRFSNIRYWLWLGIGLGAMPIFYLAFQWLRRFGLNSHGIYEYVGLMVAGALFLVKTRVIKDRSLWLLAGLSIAFAELLPLGSANGLSNLIFGIWLVSPLFWCLLLERIRYEKSRESKFSSELAFASFGLGFGILALCSSRIWHGGYRENYALSQKRYSIDRSELRLVYTNRDRANVMRELLYNLDRFSGANSKILAYPSLCLVYYLSRMPPYIPSAWPNGLRNDKFRRELETASLSGVLPLIVRAKFDPRSSGWPIDHENIFQGPGNFEDANIELTDKFVALNRYIKVFENDFFEIWKPPSLHDGERVLVPTDVSREG